jgi:hypothetical protein
MIYDYIVSPHPRRLVFTTECLPTVTIPVDPALFGDILDLVDQDGKASAHRLQRALRQGLNMLRLQSEISDDATPDGGACGHA